MNLWKRFTRAWRIGDPLLDHVRSLAGIFFVLVGSLAFSVALTYFCYWIYTLFTGGADG